MSPYSSFKSRYRRGHCRLRNAGSGSVQKKGGEMLTALQRNDIRRTGLQRLFFIAFIAVPHHAADLAACAHHLCRQHGFGAALGHIQVHNGLFCGCFSGFTHFCHGTFTSGLIVRNPCILTVNGKMSRRFCMFTFLLQDMASSFHDKLLDNMRGLNYIYKRIDRCTIVLMPFLISTTLIVLT